MPESQPLVILFDGVCNLCNGFVNFLMERDTENQFRFASLQSDFGEKMLRENGFQTDDLQSVIVLENNETSTKSTAVFKIISRLPGWRWLLIFRGIPSFITDAIYGFIARNRYRIFGKRQTCRLPSPNERAKFLG